MLGGEEKPGFYAFILECVGSQTFDLIKLIHGQPSIISDSVISNSPLGRLDAVCLFVVRDFFILEYLLVLVTRIHDNLLPCMLV